MSRGLVLDQDALQKILAEPELISVSLQTHIKVGRLNPVVLDIFCLEARRLGVSPPTLHTSLYFPTLLVFNISPLPCVYTHLLFLHSLLSILLFTA